MILCSIDAVKKQPPQYDAFGVFGTTLQKKIGAFHSSSLRTVPKTPNASHLDDERGEEAQHCREARHVAAVLEPARLEQFRPSAQLF